MYVVTSTLVRLTTATIWYPDYDPQGHQALVDFISSHTGFVSLTDEQPDEFTRIRVLTFDTMENWDAYMRNSYRSEELLTLMTYIFQEGIQIRMTEPS